MSKKYNVTYVNHLDENGCTFEYPTDDFNANGAEIETFDFVSSKVKKGADYALETWRYEVPNEDAGRFEIGLDRMFSEGHCTSWKRVR